MAEKKKGIVHQLVDDVAGAAKNAEEKIAADKEKEAAEKAAENNEEDQKE